MRINQKGQNLMGPWLLLIIRPNKQSEFLPLFYEWEILMSITFFCLRSKWPNRMATSWTSRDAKMPPGPRGRRAQKIRHRAAATQAEDLHGWSTTHADGLLWGDQWRRPWEERTQNKNNSEKFPCLLKEKRIKKRQKIPRDLWSDKPHTGSFSIRDHKFGDFSCLFKLIIHQ